MLSTETKSVLYGCIIKQFPDAGLYRISRINEWLYTNGYSLKDMGYGSFRAFAEDFPEMFSFQDDNNDEFIEIKKWQVGEEKMFINFETNHPADSFFGKGNIILNDDIIEMSQRSLYALTKILGNGYTVQQMKQTIYEKFDEAKKNQKLDFFGERYTFPIDYCRDGMLVNGIITKNISPYGKSLYFSFEKTRIQCPSYGEDPAAPMFGAAEGSQIVPKEVVDKVYRLLTENFECERRLHMATVSKFLTDHGVDRLRYGYYKMKDFLADMGFLEMEEEILGGVPQIMVTVHAKKDASSSPVPSAEKTFREALQYRTSEPESAIPTGRLSDFCNLPAKPMAILENYTAEKGKFTDFYRLIDTLNDDYDSARRNKAVRLYDSKIIFPISIQKEDGSSVELTLKPSTYEGKGWFLYYVDTIVRERNGFSGDPGKQLENFAFLGSWSSFLSELANKAVDEQWDFVDGPNRRYQILQQYIKYTFSRLVRENKICISSDKQFAAFNTGLADNHYDDIYACFIPNDASSDTEWRFAGFCTAASGGLGKQLVNFFNPLPMPPSYFKHNKDLFFDHTKQLHTDFEHIIIDNIKRLPIQFLYDQFFDYPEVREIVDKIRECPDKYLKNSYYNDLKNIIYENNRLFLRIQNRIKDSIELARKRVRWNYKTAVPSYFPKRDSMSLMLPLALCDESTPDVALVVELTRSGSYQGQTILTLPQAYIDARLMCRLTGDWLVPEKLISTYEDDRDLSPAEDDLADME